MNIERASTKGQRVKSSLEQEIDADRLLTSHEVGALLQVNPSSINKWVKEGRIAAFRTPGGHRRIRARDLVEFLDRHHMPVPALLRSASRRRLIAVDGDPAALKALEKTLRPYQDRVQLLPAASGIDALMQVGLIRPHAVVLDASMDEIDAIEVCRRIKANPETRGITVILTAAHVTPSLENKATAAGASHVLKKPVELTTLLGDLGIAPTGRTTRG
jgi:excisionase family DNA binding protein